MEILIREMVVEWFRKNYSTHTVLRELGEDLAEEAARIFKITYNEARICEGICVREKRQVVKRVSL